MVRPVLAAIALLVVAYIFALPRVLGTLVGCRSRPSW